MKSRVFFTLAITGLVASSTSALSQCKEDDLKALYEIFNRMEHKGCHNRVFEDGSDDRRRRLQVVFTEEDSDSSESVEEILHEWYPETQKTPGRKCKTCRHLMQKAMSLPRCLLPQEAAAYFNDAKNILDDKICKVDHDYSHSTWDKIRGQSRDDKKRGPRRGDDMSSDDSKDRRGGRKGKSKRRGKDMSEEGRQERRGNKNRNEKTRKNGVNWNGDSTDTSSESIIEEETSSASRVKIGSSVALAAALILVSTLQLL